MPASHVDVTDVDQFDDPVQSIKDGYTVNGTNILLTSQQLANRTRNNRNRLDRKIRIAADIAAVKALTAANRENGDMVFVSDKQKIYVFNASSSASSDEPWVLVPSAGSGRWLVARSGDTTYASGAIAISEASTSSTSYVDVTASEITLPVNASVGDRLEFELGYQQKSSSGSETSFLRVVCTENGGSVLQITAYDMQVTATSYANETTHVGFRAVATAGQVKVKVQHKITNGAQTSSVRAGAFRARLVRL